MRMCWSAVSTGTDSPSSSSNACQLEITRNNSGNAPLSEKRTHVSRRFWKREPFSFCRAYWSAVTKCPRSTCSWRTSYTTWGTTLAIRSFNVDVIMTFSSFGCNGAPRYKTHRTATKSCPYISPLHIDFPFLWAMCTRPHRDLYLRYNVLRHFLGHRGFREAHGPSDGTDGVHG